MEKWLDGVQNLQYL